MIWEEKRRWAH